MIQATFNGGHPLTVPAEGIGTSPFLRDRTTEEAVQWLRGKVDLGEFIPGVYRVYENGEFKISINLEQV